MARAPKEYLSRADGKFFYFVTRETVDKAARLHARMIFYNGEDPATGIGGGCACRMDGGARSRTTGRAGAH